MQNALINVNERDLGNGAVQTVNARDLHAFLEVGKVFAAWIQERIEQYGFTENVDFVCFPISESKGRGGHNRKDYALTLDMAKELAMVERNEKGKQARQYFIECERKAKSVAIDPMKVLNDPAALRGLLSNYSEKVEQLQSQVQALEAKADTLEIRSEALDRIAALKGGISITAAAKVLQVYKRDDLFVWLQHNKWIYRRAGNPVWYAYQDKLQRGLMAQKVYDITRTDGTTRMIEQALITPKGLTHLAELLSADQMAA